jgi:hypothetical protein
MILSNATSSAKNDNKLINSSDYATHSYTRETISDRIGKGFKHIFRSTRAGLPEFYQIFYTYQGKDFLIIESELRDSQELVSNKFIPIQAQVNIEPNHTQSLLVPFDNDTFISYKTNILKPGEEQVSSEVTAMYLEQDKSGLIAGSIEQDIWKTGIHTRREKTDSLKLNVEVGYTSKDLTRDEISHGVLKSNRLHSSKIFLGYFSDWRKGMDQYADCVNKLQKRVAHKFQGKLPIAWNSWGVMQQQLNMERALKVTSFFADSVKGNRDGNAIYIDLDSYWDNMLKGGLEGDYSQLKKFASEVKAKGLKPGIYWAPFVDWRFGSGGDRVVEGSTYKYKDIWTKVGSGYHDIDGARALDPTHPGTQQRLTLVINKLKECGFEMIKVDFLGHAAAESSEFYDKNTHTGMQAYHIGMQSLVDQLNGTMLIYAAISPNLATAPYVQMRRIACDAFNTIKHTEYTLNSLTYGWWQGRIYDFLDADHIVFKDANENENQARFISSILTGSIVFGDDFSQEGHWEKITKKLFSNDALWQINQTGKPFLPVETNSYASRIFVSHYNNAVYIALLNYQSSPEKLRIQKEQLGLSNDKTYELLDMNNNQKIILNSPDTQIPLEAKQGRIFQIKNIK